MKYINSFDNYKVNETLGIVESTLFYVDLIKSEVQLEILDFIGTSPEIGEIEETKITIPYSDIRRYITDTSLYLDFPVSEIVIELTMIKKSTENVKSRNIDTKEKKQIPFKVGGYASPFATGRENAATRIKDPIRVSMEHNVSLHMGIDFEYSSIFKKDKHDKTLDIKIESVILHELNHLYEYYQRKIKGNPPIELTTTWTSIGSNRNRRPKVIWEYWQTYFTEYVYAAEPHEVRATIQEAKAFVDKLDFNAFKKTNIWKTAKAMENYDYASFKNDINKIITKHNPEYVDKIIDVLVQDFIREYKRLSAEYKEENFVKASTLEKMSTDEFLEFWQNKIKKAGSTIIRKMIRLFTYKKDEEEEYLD